MVKWGSVTQFADDDSQWGGRSSLRSRTDTTYSEWDPVADQELKQRWGWRYLVGLLLCIFFYWRGMTQPLLEIRTFPKTGLEHRTVKSTLETVRTFMNSGFYFAALALGWCCMVIPVMKFIGTSVIIWDNFFANSRLPLKWHNVVVSGMHVSSSYQMVDLFCAILFVCFFTTEGSTTVLLGGFYWFSTYCVLSICLLQLMENLEEKEEDTQEEEVVPSVTGFNIRRRYSDWFPSLPGIKIIKSVDSVQVTFFALLYFTLLYLSLHEPLLDVRTMVHGIVFERRVLSLRELVNVVSGSTSVITVMGFVLLVWIIPMSYGVIMLLLGLVDAMHRCGGGELPDWYDQLRWVADLLRPWSMTDVFAVALLVFLFSVQSSTVVARIPDGLVHIDPDSLFPPHVVFGAASDDESSGYTRIWTQFFSGIYLASGAGMATFFLRWFWSSKSGGHIRPASFRRSRVDTFADADRVEHLDLAMPRSPRTSTSSSPVRKDTFAPEPGTPESFVALLCGLCGKSVRCLFFWLLGCFAMHSLPPSVPYLQLEHVNKILNDALPSVNSLIGNNLPATFGRCEPEDIVPLPCMSAPALYKKNLSDTRLLEAVWVSGLNTTRLSRVQISHTETRNYTEAMGVSEVRGFTLEIDGEIAEIALFLHVLECGGGLNGSTSCHPIYWSSDACCGTSRHFSVRIAAECSAGDHELSDVHVERLDIDPLLVAPELSWAGITVSLEAHDIAPAVAAVLRDKLTQYLTVQRMIWWGTKYLSIADIFNKILRYNSPHDQFRC